MAGDVPDRPPGERALEADGLGLDPSSDTCLLCDNEEEPQPFWASHFLVRKEGTELPPRGGVLRIESVDVPRCLGHRSTS